jgi:hypothetical protein
MRIALSALALAAGLLAQSAAQAVALSEPVSPANYADTLLPGTTLAQRPELAGTVLEDVSTPFSFQGITGSVQNRVVRETGTGTLDFYWKINVDSSATGEGVGALRLIDMGVGHLKDADWRQDGLGTVGANTARLFNPSSYPTGALNFLFDNGIAPGAQSHFLLLRTQAVAYAKTAHFDLLSTGPQNLSGVYSTFAPAVPEPSTYAMAAVGLVVVGAVARRRRAV